MSFHSGTYKLTAKTRALSALVLWLPLNACLSSGTREVNTELLDNMQYVLSDAAMAYEPPATVAPDALVLRELIPGLSLSDDLLAPVAERFNVVAEQQPARDFFNNLVAGTDYGVIVSPGVEGLISINLPNVTIDEVMNTVQRIYRLDIQRDGMIYHIGPRTMQTRVFTIDYLNVSRQGSSSASVNIQSSGGSGGGSSGGASGGSSGGASGGSGGGGGGGGGGGQVTTSTQTDFWADIQSTLESMVSGGASATASSSTANGSGLLAGLGTTPTPQQTQQSRVIVQPQVGLVMVTAYPEQLAQVEEYLRQAQDILSREVTIQVQFLEVVLNKGFQSAIDFDTFGPDASTANTVTGSFGSDNISIDGISNPLAIATNFTDFNAVFQILESRGTTQVLSSPSLKVLNNQKALFQDGDQEYFQTGVGSNVVSTGSSTTQSSANSLQPFFSGIAMDITPQISADGTITLHVHPTITTVSEQTKPIAGEQVPLARTAVRELDSIIRAQDGRIVVLGGLAYERNVDDTAGIPFANDLPVVGAAFDQQRRSTVKSEFIILLRPIIASPQSEQQLLRERNDRLRDINRSLNPFAN